MLSCSSDRVAPIGPRAGRHRHPHHDLVGLAQGDAEDGVDVLVLLDDPHHLLGGVADVLGGLRQVQQPAQRRRVEVLGAGPQHPQLETVLHLVEPVLEVADLGGQALVAEHQRRVGQAHRHLGDVLHLDQHVDGPVEVGQAAVLGRLGRAPVGRRGQLAQPDDARRRPFEEQHVTGHQHLVALDVGDPVPVAPDGHHPHARGHRQLEGAERTVGHVRALADEHPVRDLLGRREVGHQLAGDAQAGGSRCGRCRRRRWRCARWRR